VIAQRALETRGEDDDRRNFLVRWLIAKARSDHRLARANRVSPRTDDHHQPSNAQRTEPHALDACVNERTPPRAGIALHRILAL
jgi:hypothetical protein